MMTLTRSEHAAFEPRHGYSDEPHFTDYIFSATAIIWCTISSLEIAAIHLLCRNLLTEAPKFENKFPRILRALTYYYYLCMVVYYRQACVLTRIYTAPLIYSGEVTRLLSLWPSKTVVFWSDLCEVAETVHWVWCMAGLHGGSEEEIASRLAVSNHSSLYQIISSYDFPMDTDIFQGKDP